MALRLASDHSAVQTTAPYCDENAAASEHLVAPGIYGEEKRPLGDVCHTQITQIEYRLAIDSVSLESSRGPWGIAEGAYRRGVGSHHFQLPGEHSAKHAIPVATAEVPTN